MTTTPRGRTKACIVRRGDKWQVKQPLPGGGYRRTTTGTRKKDAEALRDELNRRAALGAAYTAPPETWKAFYAKWRQRYAQRVRPATLEQANTALRHLDLFDDRLIETLTRAEVEDHVQVIAKSDATDRAGRAPRANQVLGDAKARGQVVDPRIFDIERPRVVEREPFFPTWQQAVELASWMPEYISRIVPFALASGLRQGELFRLADRDVDLGRGMLDCPRGEDPVGRPHDRPRRRRADARPRAAARTPAE